MTTYGEKTEKWRLLRVRIRDTAVIALGLLVLSVWVQMPLYMWVIVFVVTWATEGPSLKSTHNILRHQAVNRRGTSEDQAIYWVSKYIKILVLIAGNTLIAYVIVQTLHLN